METHFFVLPARQTSGRRAGMPRPLSRWAFGTSFECHECGMQQCRERIDVDTCRRLVAVEHVVRAVKVRPPDKESGDYSGQPWTQFQWQIRTGSSLVLRRLLIADRPWSEWSSAWLKRRRMTTQSLGSASSNEAKLIGCGMTAAAQSPSRCPLFLAKNATHAASDSRH